MDFYEELGVSRSASPEEIRQAYRLLARLVHPDQCADGKLRMLAEVQMTRVNGIMAVLGDAEARRRYDAGLDASHLLPALRPGGRNEAIARMRRWLSEAPRWAWAAGGMAAMAALWVLRRGSPEDARRVPAAAAAVESGTAGSKRVAQGKRAGAPAAERRKADEAEAAAVQRAPAPIRLFPAPEAPEAMIDMESVPAGARGPAPLQPAAPAGREEPSPRAVPRFAGSWYLVPGRTKPGNLYPAEYIELRVSEADGRVRGRYRARYRVTDRAISPSVSFDFEGTASAPAAVLPWTGAGGAMGQIALKLVSDNVMEVGWRAHRLSDELGLVSGVSVLLRELEP
jgi:curved DNA-binding protein CbpA